MGEKWLKNFSQDLKTPTKKNKFQKWGTLLRILIKGMEPFNIGIQQLMQLSTHHSSKAVIGPNQF